MNPALLAPRTILVFCDGGFANRVNSLVGGLVLAERFGLAPKVLWPRNNRCRAGFGELFDMALEAHDVRLQDLVPVQHELQLWLHENDVGFTAPVAPLRQLAHVDLVATLLRGDDRPVLYAENSVLPWLPADAVRRALRRLSFQPALVARAKALIDTHGGAGHVGIHLRGTDFTSPPPTDEMLALVRKQRGTRFFVCSDEPALEALFAAEPNVFVHAKASSVAKLAEGPWRCAVSDSDGLPYTSNVDRGAASVADACVDLLVLAAGHPLKTSTSSFLALAERLREAAGAAPAKPAPPPPQPFTSQREIVELLNLLRPYHMMSDHKVRIGGDADGGYVMPSLALATNTVVSIGIGDQVSFDEELAGRGAVVHQYDHTIPGAPKAHPNFRFHGLGWGAADEGPLRTLATMMSGIDWAAARHPILKFDTEGAEWGCLAAARSEDLARFAVIAGEFHGFHNLVHRPVHDAMRAVFQKIRRTHWPVHLHANNATGIQLVLGVPVPPLLEITFVRRDLVAFAGHSTEPIPGPLDRPNMADRPDICLRPF